MQAANVRSVGELFGSEAQVSRIARLEEEVRELRDVVNELRSRGVFPRGSNPLRVMNLSDVTSVEAVPNAHKPVSEYYRQIRVSNR